MPKISVKMLLAVALALAAIGLVVRPVKTTNASTQEIFGVCVSQVPSEWGEFKGGSEQTGIAFQDRRGTIRFITNFPCNGAMPPVALEVRRGPQ